MWNFSIPNGIKLNMVFCIRCLIIMFSFVLLTSCDFRSSEDHHRAANKLEQEGKFTEAIACLDNAIRKDPHNIKALLDRAVDKSILNDFKGAIDDYTRVSQLDSANGLAFLNRGKNKMRLEDYTGALVDFDKAIATKGGESLYVDNVENPSFENSFEYDVKMEEIRFERGIAYYRTDSLNESFEDFNFCVQKSYLLPECYYWTGIIYLRYDMNPEGCRNLRKAMELGEQGAKEVVDKYCGNL